MEKQSQLKKPLQNNGCTKNHSVAYAAKIITHNPSRSECYIKAVDNSVSVVVKEINLKIDLNSIQK